MAARAPCAGSTSTTTSCMFEVQHDIDHAVERLGKRKMAARRPRGRNNVITLLNKSERKHLGIYTKLWKKKFSQDPEENPNAMFGLGDNPLKRICWSGGSNKLPTFKASVPRQAPPSKSLHGVSDQDRSR